MEILLGLMFWIALIGAISTYGSQVKRWWGTRGYRVRIVRRNCWIGLGAAFALLLAIYLPENQSAKRAQPAPTASGPAEEAVGGPKPTAAAATNAPASPAPEAEATAESGPAAGNTGYYCGTERWPVKTLSDEDRDRVNLRPVPSTVAAMRELPRPALLPDNRRAAPVELTTYTVRAVLLEIRFENDHDIHLVIADPSDQHKTMIAEIVDPSCSGAIASPDVADLRRIRENFTQAYSPPPGQKYWPKPGDVMEITGVGFFDFEHGQSGVAPNAIELHPVLGIRRAD